MGHKFFLLLATRTEAGSNVSFRFATDFCDSPKEFERDHDPDRRQRLPLDS
jgi:hypothetical protein